VRTSRFVGVMLVTLALCVAGGVAPGQAQVAEPASADGVSDTGAAADQPASTAGAPATTQQQELDEDFEPNPAQPDFTLVNLPTALRLPRFKGTFRVTHRFFRPLGAGDFGDLIEDAFGIDSGAMIGLEYRFSLIRGTQVGFHRTRDKTIQLFAQGDILRQSENVPIGVTGWASIGGRNNLRDDHSPALGAIMSRTFGRRGAMYIAPIWVNNTNSLPSALVDDNNTVIIGVGGRVRIRPTVFLVAEVTPRVAGFDPGTHLASFAIEKQVGGHMFQLNFSNGFATTIADIARGAANADDWYMGFNISRKFF